MNIKSFAKAVLQSMGLLIVTLNLSLSTNTVFPDLSKETDAALNTRIKSGVAEVCIGLTLEYFSKHVPKVNWGDRSKSSESETFGPKTVKAMGTISVISGAKDLFFGSQEKYKRSWVRLKELNKGLLDLTTAALIYGVTYYMPTLYDPYLELGGQGAALLLYSFLGIRGLKYLTLGLKDAVVKADLTDVYTMLNNRVRNKAK